MTNIRIESVYSHKSEGSITSIWEQYNSLRNWDKNNPHNYDMYSEFLFWADCELDNTKIIIIDKIQITNPENCSTLEAQLILFKYIGIIGWMYKRV